MNKNTTTAPKRGKKLIILLLILIIAVIPVVYIRVNPKWTPAELTIKPSKTDYKVQYVNSEGMTLKSRITPPEGYSRVPVESGSFAEYLRNYPLHPDKILLPVYNGDVRNTDSPAIFDISLGNEGYQQCADSIIRLYSDYFYENQQFDKISFEFSNGDVCNYNRWRKGKRMLALGDFSCEIPAGFPDDSEQGYRNYLKSVMNYAGTLSLINESKPISTDEMRVGDIICDETHVVLIVDEAVNEKGEKVYLIGQSFIPAVCFHIVTTTNGNAATPWFTQEQLAQESFTIDSFGFSKNNIRRWKDGF